MKSIPYSVSIVRKFVCWTKIWCAALGFFCWPNIYWALEWTLRSNGNEWLNLGTGGAGTGNTRRNLVKKLRWLEGMNSEGFFFRRVEEKYSGKGEIWVLLQWAFWDPMVCTLPGSSIHGIFQARIQKWVPLPSPGDLPNPGIQRWSPSLQADSLLSEPLGKPWGHAQ